jgi:zinc transport system substrate-binding protein
MDGWKHCRYLILFIPFLASCSGSDSPTAKSEKHSISVPRICVVNYPLKYFAERIAGNNARVEFPAPAGVDPVYWTPDVNIIETYQKADLILLNGASYAKWINKVSLPKSKLVDTSGNFPDQYIKINDAVTHKHGPSGEHEHSKIAFTTWLNPKLAIKHARAIESNLLGLIPDKKEIFRRNYTALEQDLLAIDKNIEQTVALNKTLPLIVSHPVYDYLIQRYGLNVRSLHWEPDEMPDEKMWRELNILLTKHPAKWIIWEDEPLKEIQEKLRTLGIKSIVFNPCGNKPQTGDYLSVMQQNVTNFKTVFQYTKTTFISGENMRNNHSVPFLKPTY